MLLDVGPLRHNTAFRRLFASQFISGLGTMVSYVAVPWQLYQLTHSNAQVGLLGLVQLVPVVVCGLLGGVVADRVDRKRLLIGTEALMALCVAGLLANALTAMPSALAIYALVAVLQGASGFHRPALEALTQKLARPEEFAAVAALSSVRGTVGMVAGPALAGLLLARWGAVGAYLVDFASFIAAMFFLARIPRECIGRVDTPAERPHLLADLAEGVRFAWARPELMGTYIVDIVAMAFAFPIAAGRAEPGARHAIRIDDSVVALASPITTSQTCYSLNVSVSTVESMEAIFDALTAPGLIGTRKKP